MDKSFVTLVQAICIVCNKPFDTNELAIDLRLKERFEMHTVMTDKDGKCQLGLCPEHQRMKDEGFVALVEIDPEKSGISEATEQIDDPHNAYRTGIVAHVKRRVWDKVFDMLCPEGAVAFVQPGVIQHLQSLMAKE
jgi:hypothetical protein